MKSCVFCEIIAGRSPAEVVLYTPHVLGIVPLNPVTEGHVIFIPKEHVDNAIDTPSVTAITMQVACRYGKERASSNSMNMITSVGEDATQTVNHLHIHLVPRRYGDILTLPWTPARVEVTSYRSIDDKGNLWCQSHSPGEVVKMSVGHPGQLEFQKYVHSSTKGQWLPWDIS